MPSVQGYADHCKTAQDVIAAAAAVRARLRRPPNAVEDRPISLKRVSGITGYEAARIRAEIAAERERALQQARLEAETERLREMAQKITPAPEDPEISIAKPAKIRAIQYEVARQWRIEVMEMFSERRTQNVVVPRQIAMVLSKRLTLLSLPEIGRRFGGRDHTTVLHSIRKYQWLLDQLSADMPKIATLSEWVAAAKRVYLNGPLENKEAA